MATFLCNVPGTKPGVTFNVFITEPGDWLERQHWDGSLIPYDRDERDALVEFFDARYTGEGFQAAGQHVASYGARTIMGEASFSRPGGISSGLDLLTYEPSWKIGPEGGQAVMDAIQRYRNKKESALDPVIESMKHRFRRKP